MPRRLPAFAVVVLCCFLCVACAARVVSATGIRSASLESMPGAGDGSYTVTVFDDGKVLFDDVSELHKIMGKAHPGLRGSVSKGQVQKLFALIEKEDYAGKPRTPYSSKRREKASERRARLVLTFADGSMVINSGPGNGADAADKRHFADIEDAFVRAAESVGAKGLNRLYDAAR